MDIEICTKYPYKTYTNRRVPDARVLDRDDGPRRRGSPCPKERESVSSISHPWRRRERWMRCLPTFPRDAPGWYTRSPVVRVSMDIIERARAMAGDRRG